MKDLLCLVLSLFILNGCTYSVMLNHTEGITSDLVDENQAASAKINNDMSIPL